MRLQFQLFGGRWADCNKGSSDRTEDFLSRCQKANGIDKDNNIVPRSRALRDLTREEVCVALIAGKELYNGELGWESACRDGDFIEKKLARGIGATNTIPDYPHGRELGCGHTVYKVADVQTGTLGMLCTVCYTVISQINKDAG